MPTDAATATRPRRIPGPRAGIVLLLLVGHFVATGSVLAGGPDAGAARYLPARTLAVAVLNDGDRAIERLGEMLAEQEFVNSRLYETISANAELMQARIFALGIAASVSMDAWEAAGALLGRELVVGLVPTGKKPALLIVSRLRDPQRADELLDSIYTLTGLSKGGVPDPQRSKTVDGVTAYRLGDDAYFCRVDDCLVFSSARSALAPIVEGNVAEPLTASKSFRQARTRIPEDASAWGYVDLQSLRTALAPRGGFPEMMRNPLAAYLFGGWYHTIRHADSACAWATVNGETLRVELETRADADWPDSHGGFTQPVEGGVTWNASDLPRFLSSVEVSRDWAALFAEREALLTLPAAGKVTNFSTNISNLFGGLDFINDILPSLGGPTRLIAARQKFDEQGTVPVPRLPAFALVMPLRADSVDRMEQRLFSATQSALAILNIDMAQKSLPTYLIDIDRHRGVRMLFSTFAHPADTSGMEMGRRADGADAGDAPAEVPAEAGIRYNFAPATSVVEGQFVLATSEQLLRDVIDAIIDARDGAALAAARVEPDRITLDAESLTEILLENRRELVINRMLEEDQPKADAERDIDTLLGLLRYTRSLSATSNRTAGGYRAILELALRNPAR